MTKPGRSVIALLLDRSSALAPLRDEIRAGVSALLADQAARTGDVEVYAATTGRKAGKLGGGIPAADASVPALRGRGTAAVRDSLGALVTALGGNLAGMPEQERPERVFLLVVTGGADEGSATWGPDELRDLVATQERDYAWEVLTVTVAEHAGLAPWGEGHRSIGAVPTAEGVRFALAAASEYLGRAREVGPWQPVPGFSQEQRCAAYPPSYHLDEQNRTDETGAETTQAIPVITAERLAEADRADAEHRRRWWQPSSWKQSRKPANA
ncbi:hypothetical protein [Pseudonocardia ailaonensis]|uniref:hypothetical protein n=1 Tax=Pseudonocardia ailaonensis TaxID=367279 RepID=UPI0031DEF2EF